ncbi:nitrite reductase large subunit NirB [Lacisediminimonas profundi]|uniref:nitrite reductase large subunit NirB n=1 Tax=Lacisediminimonas profundi TaxID=2603856 RepID=UPI0019D67D2C|nr:nitrite reductase large subunit NirB [Lacisediminimonas profundi]
MATDLYFSSGAGAQEDKPRLVLVGHGMVGQNFLEQLVERGLHAHYQVLVLGEEPRAAYDRVHLSEFFAGKTADELAMASPDFFTENRIDLRLGTRVAAIDRQARTLTDSAGNVIGYDKLVLATGSFPFVPPIDGRGSQACCVYRTIDDLEQIRHWSDGAKAGVVVGGGLLGLEAANALRQLGLQTHVVEFAPRLMPVQLDELGGAMLRQKIEALGVHVHVGYQTQRIVPGSQCRLRMEFAGHDPIETDLVVFSAGIRPRDELGRIAGLETGARGGIAIDGQCRTSDADIFCIGEAAARDGKIFGLVKPGYQMARTVARVLAGEQCEFEDAESATQLKLLGVDVASMGDAHGVTPGAQSFTFMDGRAQVYKRLVTDARCEQVLGAVLVGNVDEFTTLSQMMSNRIPLPAQPEALILPATNGQSSRLLGPAALPDTAQICSCHNVEKGTICAAVGQGAMTVADLKSATKAATGCGGCVQLVKQVLEHELTQRGVEVKKDICEHFAFSRQELYHLVRVGEIRTFRDLVAKHGKGLGCEICKPAAASIFASVWNEHVLERQHLPLQDTNDRFLANIQKDGTYSIVPRVPGGEITADKLIVLGQVAKEAGLYTKITGGQRIDLFGARLDDLPKIWDKLIAAGFETGQAYGKSLRTVKSCVGSTWCRYGVQDSTGLALELEDRYKGLRAPHKIKFGVSGCTRECAEAQSKDIGVIATEKGWNLYVCGNGGMKPRHADLFAVDLSTPQLVRLIDRVLMFYIRTADRLQRTSTWMNNLEGGLDYLKSVVIDDALGIGADLDAQMQHVVDTFQCEWKTAIDTPQKRQQFRSLVNLDSGAHGVSHAPGWQPVCSVDDLVADAGVAALIDGRQVAIFYLPGQAVQAYAIDNQDPFTGTHVLSRGIVGDTQGRPFVASPLYKQRFALADGACLDDPGVSVRTWPIELRDGKVYLLHEAIQASGTSATSTTSGATDGEREGEPEREGSLCAALAGS